MRHASSYERTVATGIDTSLVMMISYIVFTALFTFLTGDASGSYNEVVGTFETTWVHELSAVGYILIIYGIYLNICYLTKRRMTIGQRIIGIKVSYINEKWKIKDLLIRSWLPLLTFWLFPLYWRNRETHQSFYEKWSNTTTVKYALRFGDSK